MANLFARAASSLLADQPQQADRCPLPAGGACYAAATAMDGGPAEPKTRQRGQLLNAASRFLQVFELAAPDAPGLVGLGAQFDPAMADPMHAGCPAVGVSGVGLSLQDAFQGCIGEGIEYLSQLQTGDDVLVSPGSRDPAAAVGPQTREFLAALSAHRLRADAGLSWYRDRVHQRRATAIDADRCLLLQPVAEPVIHLPIEATDANAVVRLIATRLEQLGIETFSVDLTRPRFAVPVARIIAPGLQLEPSELVTPRLATMIAQTGGGERYTGGVLLI